MVDSDEEPPLELSEDDRLMSIVTLLAQQNGDTFVGRFMQAMLLQPRLFHDNGFVWEPLYLHVVDLVTSPADVETLLDKFRAKDRLAARDQRIQALELQLAQVTSQLQVAVSGDGAPPVAAAGTNSHMVEEPPLKKRKKSVGEKAPPRRRGLIKKESEDESE